MSLGTLPRSVYLEPALPRLYMAGCLLCVVQTGKGFLSFSASWLLSFVNLDVPLYPVSMLLPATSLP